MTPNHTIDEETNARIKEVFKAIKSKALTELRLGNYSVACPHCGKASITDISLPSEKSFSTFFCLECSAMWQSNDNGLHSHRFEIHENICV